MGKRRNRKDLSAAVDRLSALFEFGDLLAATDAAELLNLAVEEIKRLRSGREELRESVRGYWANDSCEDSSGPATDDNRWSDSGFSCECRAHKALLALEMSGKIPMLPLA